MALELPSRWVADFKRDWNAMIDSMAFREQRRSLLRWLREPIHASSWRQAKASAFSALQASEKRRPD
jgi:hypothetical protein